MSAHRSLPPPARVAAGAAAVGGLGALLVASGVLGGGDSAPSHDALDAHPFARGHADPLDVTAGWPESASALPEGQRDALLEALRAWLLGRGAWIDRVRVQSAGEDKGLGLFYAPEGGAQAWAGSGRPVAVVASSASPPSSPSPRLLASFPLLSTLSLPSLALTDSTVAAMAAHSSDSFPSGEREVLTAWLAAQRALGRLSEAAPWVAAVGARQEGVGGWTPREVAFLRGTTLGAAAEARGQGRAVGREEALLRGANAILRGRVNLLEVEREEREERARNAAGAEQARAEDADADEPPAAPSFETGLASELFPPPRDEVTLGDLRWADAVFWSRVMALPLEMTAERVSADGAESGRAAPTAPTFTTTVEGIVPGLDFANAASAEAARLAVAVGAAALPRPNAVWAVVGDEVMLASPPGSGLLPGDGPGASSRGVGALLGRVLARVWGVVARAHGPRAAEMEGNAGKTKIAAKGNAGDRGEQATVEGGKAAEGAASATPTSSSRSSCSSSSSTSSSSSSSPALPEIFIDYGSKSNEELLFAYGFTLPPSPQDSLMLAGTLPSLGVKDATEAAVRVEVLKSLGSFPPQVFLPILVGDDEREERDRRDKAATLATRADARSQKSPRSLLAATSQPPSPEPKEMWRVGSRFLDAHTKEVLEALVAPYEEILARARALERGNAPRHMPGFGAAPAPGEAPESPVARASRLGNELALLSTLAAMLEHKALAMEGAEEGTGRLEDDQTLLARVERIERGESDPAAPSQDSAANGGDIPPRDSPSFRRFACALRYRMAQKMAARIWLGEVRAAQQEVMRALAAEGGVAYSEAPKEDKETYGVQP